MNDIVNIIVNNGVAVGVVIYFLIMNYKYFDKLTSTLTEITLTLKDIQDDIKGVTNEKNRSRENGKDN